MRNMPFHIESEEGVLGSALLDPSIIGKVDVKPSDFYDRKHQILWEVLLDMYVENPAIDSLMIATELEKRNKLQSVGGFERLSVLQDTVGVSAYSQHYAKEIKRTSKLRSEIKVLEDGIRSAYDGESASDEVLSRLIGMNVEEQKDEPLHVLGEKFIQDCIDGKVGHCPWWCPEWTNHLGRLSTELMILHAPRSTGKTALMVQWMLHLHETKLKAPLASLEMLSSELMPRFIAQKGQVNTYRMRARGRVTEDEKVKATLANDQVKCLELRIRDKGMSIDEIRAWAVAEAKDGADIIFIDNLLCINDGGERFDSKTVMYDHFIRRLKALRDDLKIPIVLLAHPNDSNTVAYSKNVENFADIILFLMEVPSEGVRVSGELIQQNLDIQGTHIVAKFQKNRQGISPTASLEFMGDYQTFKHLEWH